jgi:pyruvate dehydrogenase E2 component (dihydrolipoamide acetyltransferase)
MAIDVIMPQMGFDMREGTVVNWLKHEGDPVVRGDALAEIETDKATVELEAFTGGILGRIYVEEGSTVPVGDVIAVITTDGEPAPERQVTATGAPPEETLSANATGIGTEGVTTSIHATGIPARPTGGQPAPVTPVAKRIAKEAGIELDEIQTHVTGSGPNGRILRADVETYLAGRNRAPARATGGTAAFDVNPAGIVIPEGLSPMRQTIARQMLLSKLTAPHYYVTVEVDMSRAVELRRELNDELADGERISVNDLILKAVANTLAEHPHFNVTVLAQGIQQNTGVPLSVAVALDDGLLAPTLPDVAQFGLRDLAGATKDLVERARSSRLRTDEVSGIGFTISNLGMFDVKDFVAIITPPNAGAVAVGSVKATPVVKDGEVVVAQMMSMTLSADHRATDGAQGAQFMNAVRRLLEKPTVLLL